jgi:hypothetical protein
MLIGDSVTYEGRSHVVIGFTPTSVTPALIELRDQRTGARLWVERRLVREPVAPKLPAMRPIQRQRRRGQH